MIEFQFILNPETDNIAIDEPGGFGDIELSIIRDEHHGIGFEASTNALQFYDRTAIDYLTNQKQLYGLKSTVIFQALSRCEGEDDFGEILRGKLNFGKWKDTCGNDCSISLPLEEDSCIVTLHSRWDQKIDFDVAKGFDGFTSLPSYDGLGMEMELPPVAIEVGIDANVAPEGDYTTLPFVDRGGHTAYFRPLYSIIRQSSIKTPNLDTATNYGFNRVTGDPYGSVISPIVLFEDNPGCFGTPLNYTIRLKGSAVIHKEGDNFDLNNAEVVISRINNDFIDTADTRLHFDTISMPLVGSLFTGTFDRTYSGSITLREGDGLYAFIRFDVEDPTPTFDTFSIQYDITFDEETSVLLDGTKVCPPTNADVYLLHETLSRGAEAITDYCVRVKSSYYGRIDSQPFSFDSDGCGGLRFVTSGLKIRRALQDKFFTSMKELLEGLTAIDNIGFGIEEDPERTNKHLLVIEDLEHFYRDEEILRCEALPVGVSDTDESKHYSKIEVGYKKWEVEDVNGLDEPNSTREYRTSLNSVSNTLDITSNLVTGSYPIEITRQQSFANTGGADYKYDNDTFIVALTRAMYGFTVEQGNVNNPANLYSPSTIYNYRLSPLRNLMRWYRSIVNSYANISDSENKLFFSAGTGNIVAEGQLSWGLCVDETGVIKENQNLFVTHFNDPLKATPLWKNETITFEYPLSVKDYKSIKANPYGYISYECGGNWGKGFIKEVKFKLTKGTATFILKKKWS